MKLIQKILNLNYLTQKVIHLAILFHDRVQSLTIRIIMFQIETEKVKCGKSTLQNTSRCENL